MDVWLTAGMAPEHLVGWSASPVPWALVLQDEVEEEVDEDMAGAAACNVANVHSAWF